MYIKKLVVTMAALVIGGCVLYAQENVQDDRQADSLKSRQEICVDFRVDESKLDTLFMENADRLEEIVSFLEDIKSDTTLSLVEVSFYGYASPDGPIATNRRLAVERRTELENHVRSLVDLPDSIVTRGESVFGWERLALLVGRSDMPYKDEVLEIIENVPEVTLDSRGVMVDSRKKHLMDLRGGSVWRYMVPNFYTQIRNAGVIFVTVQEKPVPAPVVVPPVVTPPVDTLESQPEPVVAQPVAEPQPESEKPFYMDVKTNMLYDILAVPNIGVEFHLGRNWSVSANWMYSWWSSDRRHNYWRLYGGELGVRKWFGKQASAKPLTGHHLGVYGQVFTYDFELGGKGYIGGAPGKTLWDEPNYAVGIEYGYSLPIAKRLNIDFTVGLGYWGGVYYVYQPIDGHYVWESTRERHWFGPTKAEISLVWLLGRGNVNDMK